MESKTRHLDGELRGGGQPNALQTHRSTVGWVLEQDEVFRLTGTVAFLGYSVALLQQSIWWGKSWSSTGKSVFDGLIYALVTAGAFGWLWPA